MPIIISSLATEFSYFQDKLFFPLNFKQNKIVIIALVALSCLAVRFLYYACCLKVKKVIPLNGEARADNLQDQCQKKVEEVFLQVKRDDFSPLVKPKTQEPAQQLLDGQLEQEQTKKEIVALVEPIRKRKETFALIEEAEKLQEQGKDKEATAKFKEFILLQPNGASAIRKYATNLLKQDNLSTRRLKNENRTSC